MPRSIPFLLLTVLLMSLVGCSSAPRTVLVSPPLPLACRVQCPTYPSEPPVGSESLDDWLFWGDDVTADYLACMQLHADCTAGAHQTNLLTNKPN